MVGKENFMHRRKKMFLTITSISAALIIFFILNNNRGNVRAKEAVVHMSAYIRAPGEPEYHIAANTPPPTGSMFGTYNFFIDSSYLQTILVTQAPAQPLIPQPLPDKKPEQPALPVVDPKNPVPEILLQQDERFKKTPDSKFNFTNPFWQDITYYYRTKLPPKKYQVTRYLTNKLTKKVYMKTTETLSLTRYNEFSIKQISKKIVPPGSYILTTYIQKLKTKTIIERQDKNIYLSATDLKKDTQLLPSAIK